LQPPAAIRNSVLTFDRRTGYHASGIATSKSFTTQAKTSILVRISQGFHAGSELSQALGDALGAHATQGGEASVSVSFVRPIRGTAGFNV
jgi:hypothetical protein